MKTFNEKDWLEYRAAHQELNYLIAEGIITKL